MKNSTFCNIKGYQKSINHKKYNKTLIKHKWHSFNWLIEQTKNLLNKSYGKSGELYSVLDYKILASKSFSSCNGDQPLTLITLWFYLQFSVLYYVYCLLIIFIQEDDNDIKEEDDEEGTNTTIQELFNVLPNVEASRSHPPNLKMDNDVFTVNFSPTSELIAVGDICGHCILYRYSLESMEQVFKLTYHEESCRGVSFSDDGSTLYTIGKDSSLGIVDVQTEQLKVSISKITN